MSQPQTYTAAQMAAALRIAPRSVRRALEGVEPTTTRIVNGQQTAAWAFRSLTPALQQRFDREAIRLGFRSGVELLSRPQEPWQPTINGIAVRLSDIAQHCLDKAVNLQKVMAPLLARREQMGSGEIEALGVRDYAAVFGHLITTRHFRDLIKRTVERDGGAEIWNRLELYLDRNITRRQDCVPVATDNQFEDLHTLIVSFRNPAAPSRDEMANLWERSLDILADIPEKKTKRNLLAFLWRHVPTIAKSSNALRVNLDHKLKLREALSSTLGS